MTTNKRIFNLLCEYEQAGYDKSDRYDNIKANCDKLKARLWCYEFC